jgi:predicted amidophosphoribosyltransferase
MIDTVAARELRELARRERLYRDGRPPPEIAGRTAILVDDGLATGATMYAAITFLISSQVSADATGTATTMRAGFCRRNASKPDFLFVRRQRVVISSQPWMMSCSMPSRMRVW